MVDYLRVIWHLIFCGHWPSAPLTKICLNRLVHLNFVQRSEAVRYHKNQRLCLIWYDYGRLVWAFLFLCIHSFMSRVTAMTLLVAKCFSIFGFEVVLKCSRERMSVCACVCEGGSERVSVYEMERNSVKLVNVCYILPEIPSWTIYFLVCESQFQFISLVCCFALRFISFSKPIIRRIRFSGNHHTQWNIIRPNNHFDIFILLWCALIIYAVTIDNKQYRSAMPITRNGIFIARERKKTTQTKLE